MFRFTQNHHQGAISGICRHNTDNANIDKHIGSWYVILAKLWIWPPDDDSILTETYWSSFYNFNDVNDLRIYNCVH